MNLSLLPLGAPLLLILCSVLAFFRAGSRPASVPHLVEAGALLAALLAVSSSVLLATDSLPPGQLLGVAGVGLSV